MNYRPLFISSMLLLSGCATTDLQSTMGSIADDVSNAFQTATAKKDTDQAGTASSTPGTSATAASGNSVLNTPLAGALKRNLSTSGNVPEWPKVVITDLQIPKGQLALNRSIRLDRNECIKFNAVLWESAGKSQRFSNLSLCAPELPKQSNNFVTTWKVFPISGKTTGQVRGEGPTPPYMKLPTDNNLEQWINYQFGLYYLGSLLTIVGYDYNFTADDRRFWIKNVK